MVATEKIEIPLSKIKTSMLLIGSFAFVVLGIFFILTPETFISPIFRNTVTIRVVGIAAAVFFGLCGIFIARKYGDNKPGLIIDERGITDNTNGTSVGLIEWENIRGIQTIQVASTRILMILTDKPGKYIDRAKSGISRRAMKMNNKMYGSPLSIISGSLKIDFDELERVVTNAFEKRKNRSKPADLPHEGQAP